MPLESRNESPFAGPRPFRREDAGKFFGRDREALELVSLIYANRVVLFYAPTGAGKTSILNAAVLPQIEQEFEIFPAARVSRPAEAAMDSATANTYVRSTLISWIAYGFGAGDADQKLGNLSLADF